MTSLTSLNVALIILLDEVLNQFVERDHAHCNSMYRVYVSGLYLYSIVYCIYSSPSAAARFLSVQNSRIPGIRKSNILNSRNSWSCQAAENTAYYCIMIYIPVSS
jgi:hypothetical protein